MDTHHAYVSSLAGALPGKSLGKKPLAENKAHPHSAGMKELGTFLDPIACHVPSLEIDGFVPAV
jgi:hypothetical protein